MSASLIILLFASWLVPPAAALAGPETQSNSLGAPGCGPASIKFDVETDRNQHAAPNPEPGKALLVLLQDDSRFGAKPRPTTRFGLDGAWVGATHANSYFYVPIDPGAHGQQLRPLHRRSGQNILFSSSGRIHLRIHRCYRP